MKRDLAIFRAPEQAIAVAKARFYSEDGLPFIQARTEVPMDAVYQVTIDGVSCETVEQLSPQDFVLSVPEQSWPFAPVQYLIVVEGSLSLNASAAAGLIPVQIGFGRNLATVSGTSLAIQEAYRELMITPGSDYRNPLRGGGLLRAIRSLSLATDDAQGVVRTCVDRANRSVSAQRSRAGENRVSRIELVGAKIGTPSGFPGVVDDGGVVLRLSFRFHMKGPTGTSLVASSVEV